MIERIEQSIPRAPQATLSFVSEDFLVHHRLTSLARALHEDNVSTLQVLFRATRHSFLPHVPYRQRQRPSPITRGPRPRHHARGQATVLHFGLLEIHEALPAMGQQARNGAYRLSLNFGSQMRLVWAETSPLEKIRPLTDQKTVAGKSGLGLQLVSRARSLVAKSRLIATYVELSRGIEPKGRTHQ